MERQQQRKGQKRTAAQRKKSNRRRMHIRNVSPSEPRHALRSSSRDRPASPCEHASVVEPPASQPEVEPAVEPEVKPEVKPQVKPKAEPTTKPTAARPEDVFLSKGKYLALLRICKGDYSFRKRRPNQVALSDSSPAVVIDPTNEVLSCPKVVEKNNLPPLPLEEKENFKGSEQQQSLEESLIRRPTRPTLFIPPQRRPLAELPARAVSPPANSSRPSLAEVRERIARAQRPGPSRTFVLDEQHVPDNALRSRSQSRSRSIRRLQRKKR